MAGRVNSDDFSALGKGALVLAAALIFILQLPDFTFPIFLTVMTAIGSILLPSTAGFLKTMDCTTRSGKASILGVLDGAGLTGPAEGEGVFFVAAGLADSAEGGDTLFVRTGAGLMVLLSENTDVLK